MPAAPTCMPPGQVSDFRDGCPLIRHACLLCGFYSSDQRFAFGFLPITPHDAAVAALPTLPPDGRVEENLRLQVGAPCRAHNGKSGVNDPASALRDFREEPSNLICILLTAFIFSQSIHDRDIYNLEFPVRPPRRSNAIPPSGLPGPTHRSIRCRSACLRSVPVHRSMSRTFAPSLVPTSITYITDHGISKYKIALGL